MSKRLQVLLPDEEMAGIQQLAQRERVSVGEWVRQVLREARSRKPVNDTDTKLKAVRRAAGFSFPTADIDQMLEEMGVGDQWNGKPG